MNLLVPIGIGAIALIAMGKKKPKPKPKPKPEEKTLIATPVQTAPARTMVVGGVKTTPKTAKQAAVGSVQTTQTAHAGAYEPPPLPEMNLIIGSYVTKKIGIGRKLPVVVAGVGPSVFTPAPWKPAGGAAIAEPGKDGRHFTIIGKNPGIAKFYIYPSGKIAKTTEISVLEITVG